MSKKLKVLLSSIFIFGLFILLVSCVNGVYRSIKVELMQGTVSITDSKNETTEAYTSRKLRSGDTVETKASSSCVLKLDGDKYIYIGENSNVNIISSEHDSSLTKIRVNEGSIVTEVKNKLSDLEEFNVETPNSSMAIRGTTFGVTVEKRNNEYIIEYKLVEGKIELSVIEKLSNGYNLGVFEMNPMEEIKIIARDNAIVSGETLTDAVNKMDKNDSSVTRSTYKDVKEYISETENVILYEQELELDDVDEILEKVPENHDEEYNRVVALLSTFDVYDGTYKVASDQMKYESTKTYKIIAKAIDLQGFIVTKWRVGQTEILGGSTIELEINSTVVICPIFEAKKYAINVSADMYGDYLKVNGTSITKSTLFNAESVVLDYTPQDNLVFGGWYTLDGKSEQLLSTENHYEFTPTDDVSIYAKIEHKKYDVIVSSTMYGEFVKVNNTPMTEYVSLHASEVVLDYVPQDDLVFSGWYTMDGKTEILISKESHLELPITSNMEVYAKIEPRLYDVTVSSTIYGDFIKVNDEALTESTSLTTNLVVLDYTPQSNLDFFGWVIIEGERELQLSKETHYEYKPTIDVQIRCKLDTKKYDVTVTSDIYGDFITANNNKLRDELIISVDSIDLVFGENDQIIFSGWYEIDGNEENLLSKERTYTYEPTSDIHINAKCEYIVHDFTVSSTKYGNVKIDGVTLTEETKYEYTYRDVVLSYEAEDNVVFRGWYKDNDVNRELLSESSTYTYTITEDVKIICVLEEIQNVNAKVNVSSSAYDGFIKVNNEVLAQETEYTNTGTVMTFEYTEPTGYVFEGWYRVDGTEETLLSKEATFTYTPSEDVAIVAKYKVATYDVTVTSAGYDGYVLVNDVELTGVTKYESITEISFAIQNEDLITFYGWYKIEENEETLLSNEKSFTFTPTENTVVFAKYEMAAFDVYVSASTYDGYVLVNDVAITKTTTYNLVKELTFTLQKQDKISFSGWYLVSKDGEELLSKESTYVFIPTADSIIQAKFTLLNKLIVKSDNYNVDAVKVDGSFISEDTTIYSDSDVQLEFVDSENTYVFIGYYKETINGLVLFESDPDLVVTVTDDITLVAKFIRRDSTDYELLAYDAIGELVEYYHSLEVGVDSYVEPTKYTINNKNTNAELEISASQVERIVYERGIEVSSYSVDVPNLFTISYSFKNSNADAYQVDLSIGNFRECTIELSSNCDLSLVTLDGVKLSSRQHTFIASNYDTVELKASNSSRYTFNGWYSFGGKNPVLITASRTYEFTPMGDMSIGASFIDNSTLTLQPANVTSSSVSLLTYAINDNMANLSSPITVTGETVVDLFAADLDESIFIGWYITLADGSTSLYSSSKSLTDFNAIDAIDLGAKSIQGRYITPDNLTSMNVVLVDGDSKEEYDSNHHIKLASGEKVNTSNYSIKITDGDFTYVIDSEDLTFDFQTTDFNGVDPVNNVLEDNSYLLFVIDKNMNTLTYLETRLDINPCVLIVSGAQSGATVATNTEYNVSVGAYSSQTFEAVSSFTATVDTTSTDGTYVFLGWYEDTEVDSDPYKLLTTNKTLTMSIKRRTVVLPLFIKPYVTNAYNNSAEKQGIIMNYGKYGSELGNIEVPVGTSLYDVYDFDNQKYTAQSNQISSTKYFELDESKVTFWVSSSGAQAYSGKTDIDNFLNNAQIGNTYTLSFWIARGSCASGSYTAVNMSRTIKIVLPKGVSVEPTYGNEVTVNDVELSELYTFTEGELTLTAAKKVENAGPYNDVNAIFAGWYITYFDSTTGDRKSELYSTESTVTVDVDYLISTGNYLIQPKYVQTSDYMNNYLYSTHDLDIAVDDSTNLFLVLPGEKFTADLFEYYIEDTLYDYVLDENNNMVSAKVKVPKELVSVYIWNDESDEYDISIMDVVLENGDYDAKIELFGRSYYFTIHVGGIVATLNVPYDCTVTYSQGGVRTDVSDDTISFDEDFEIDNITCTTQGVKFLGWYEVIGGKATLLTTQKSYEYTVSRMASVVPVFITTENNYEVHVYGENNFEYEDYDDKLTFMAGDRLDISKFTFVVDNNSILYPVSSDLITTIYYDNSDEYPAQITEAQALDNPGSYTYVRFQIEDCYANKDVYIVVYADSNITINNLDHINLNFYGTNILKSDMTTEYINPEVENGKLELEHVSDYLQFYYSLDSIDSGYSLLGWYYVNSDGSRTPVTSTSTYGSNYYVTISATTEDYVIEPLFAESSDKTRLSVSDSQGNPLESIRAVQKNLPIFEKYVVTYTSGTTTYNVTSDNYTVVGYVYDSASGDYVSTSLSNLFNTVSDTTNKPYIKYTIAGTGVESEAIEVEVIALTNSINPFSISLLDSDGNLASDASLGADTITITKASGSSTSLNASYTLAGAAGSSSDGFGCDDTYYWTVSLKINKAGAPSAFDGSKIRLSITLPERVVEDELYEYVLVEETTRYVGNKQYYTRRIIDDPTNYLYDSRENPTLFIVAKYVDVMGIPEGLDIRSTNGNYPVDTTNNPYRYIMFIWDIDARDPLFTIESSLFPRQIDAFLDERDNGLEVVNDCYRYAGDQYTNDNYYVETTIVTTPSVNYVNYQVNNYATDYNMFDITGLTSKGTHTYVAYRYDDTAGQYVAIDFANNEYYTINDRDDSTVVYLIDTSVVDVTNIATGIVYGDDPWNVIRVTYKHGY